MDSPQLCAELAACLPDMVALGLLVAREYTTGSDIPGSSLLNSLKEILLLLFLILVLICAIKLCDSSGPSVLMLHIHHGQSIQTHTPHFVAYVTYLQSPHPIHRHGTRKMSIKIIIVITHNNTAEEITAVSHTSKTAHQDMVQELAAFGAAFGLAVSNALSTPPRQATGWPVFLDMGRHLAIGAVHVPTQLLPLRAARVSHMKSLARWRPGFGPV